MARSFPNGAICDKNRPKALTLFEQMIERAQEFNARNTEHGDEIATSGGDDPMSPFILGVSAGT
jgi:hypothetical protein